jgi:hypothetical protein
MPERSRGAVDLAQVEELVERLETDLARAREGSGDLDTVRGEVEQLRAALAGGEGAHPQVREGLAGLRQRLHEFGDQVFDDAVTGSYYIGWVGRILGL